MLATVYNAKPVPAVHANGFTTGHARMFQRLATLIGLTTGGASVIGKRAHHLRRIQVRGKILPLDAVQLSNPDSRQLATPDKAIDELIGNAEHFGDFLNG